MILAFQSDFATIAFWTAVLASGVRLSIPVATAAIGEMITERAGVLNLGLEGTMICGAFAGFTTAVETGSLWMGLIGGFVAGALVGLGFALLVVGLRVDQVVAGLTVTLLGLAFTSFLNTEIYGSLPIKPRSPDPAVWSIPLVRDIPLIGEPLFEQNQVAYVGAGLVVIIAVWLRRSYYGIVLDAAGESPSSADAAGHSVNRVRIIATTFGAGLAGLGGAFLVVGQLGFFNSNITAGRGWVALALVIFGRWKPGLIVVGAIFFGTLDALQFRFQGLDSAIPFEFFIALPYVVTLAALAMASKVHGPSALGTPFVRSTEAT